MGIKNVDGVYPHTDEKGHTVWRRDPVRKALEDERDNLLDCLEMQERMIEELKAEIVRLSVFE